MIEFNNVTKTYKNGVTALNSFNLRIQDGEFCFIVGRSGSGKSTLVRLLTKELDPDEGYIVVNDTDLTHLRRRHIPKYRRRLGVVFQDFRLLEDRSVYENIAFAQLIIGKTNAEIEENVSRIMELTGLSSKSRSYPRQLSGGEQQRTAIARALVNRPEILIADEPTGNLDHENALEIMHLLERINAQGTTVIVITHDREMVNRMKKRTVRMSLGEIISDTVPEESGITELSVGISAVAAENAEINTDTNSDSNTEKAGEPKPGDRSKESIEKSSEEDYEENTFETSDDTSEDDFDEPYEEPEEGCNWEDDWDEDWAEPETAESQPETSTYTVNVPDKQPDSEIKPNPTEKPRRGLKGSHRPHHKIGKEDA